MISDKLILCTALSVAAVAAFGAEPAATRSTPPPHAVHKALIVETVYPYSVAALQPALVVQPLTRSAASFDRPEDAMVAHFSAMLAGDFEWFMSTWTAPSQALMRSRDQQRARKPAYWTGLWSKVYAGRRIELLNRIDYGEYVLIEYGLYAPGEQSPGFRDTVATVKENGRWKLTQELAREPILANWNSTSGRVQVVATSAMPADQRRALEPAATERR